MKEKTATPKRMVRLPKGRAIIDESTLTNKKLCIADWVVVSVADGCKCCESEINDGNHAVEAVACFEPLLKLVIPNKAILSLTIISFLI